MLIQPIDIFVYAWLIVAAASAAYVAWDQFQGNPEPSVMKWGFVLVTLYTGPVGLLLYVMADKEPAPGKHEEFIRPLWKQGVGSTVHCVAGDATGIILAAVTVALVGLPMWADLIVEYAAGFLFGLLIFQALFMRKTMGGSYAENVRRSFLPELISMNCMMAGMAPVMVFLMMGRDMRAMWPGEPLFWMVMSLGIIAGFAIAYPVNVWMVAKGLKHGLMTERLKLAPAERGRASAHVGPAAASPGGAEGMPGMDHGGIRMTASSPADRLSAAGASGKSSKAAGGAEDSMAPSKSGGRGLMRSDVTRPQLAAITAFTLLMLIGGMTLPSAFVNLRLSAHEVGGAIMPPGMIMDNNTPAAAMLDMAAVDPRYVTATYGLSKRGATPLPPHIEKGSQGLRPGDVGRPMADPARCVGGRLCVQRTGAGADAAFRQGDRIRINVTNRLPDTTTVHWHGLILPNVMDGVGECHPEADPEWSGLCLRVHRAPVRVRICITLTTTSTANNHWDCMARSSSIRQILRTSSAPITNTRFSFRSG